MRKKIRSHRNGFFNSLFNNYFAVDAGAEAIGAADASTTVSVATGAEAPAAGATTTVEATMLADDAATAVVEAVVGSVAGVGATGSEATGATTTVEAAVEAVVVAGASSFLVQAVTANEAATRLDRAINLIFIT